MVGTSAQSFSNCNNADSFATLGLLSSVLKCVNVTVSQALSYVDTLQATPYGKKCLDKPASNNTDCVTTVLEVVKTSATTAGSVPFMVGSRVYAAPQSVCSCSVKVSE